MPGAPSAPDSPALPINESKNCCKVPLFPAANHKSYALAPSQTLDTGELDTFVSAIDCEEYELLGHGILSLIF